MNEAPGHKVFFPDDDMHGKYPIVLLVGEGVGDCRSLVRRGHDNHFVVSECQTPKEHESVVEIFIIHP